MVRMPSKTSPDKLSLGTRFTYHSDPTLLKFLATGLLGYTSIILVSLVENELIILDGSSS